MEWTVKELIEELQCYEEHKKVWIKMDGFCKLVKGVDLEEVRNGEDIVIK